MTPPAPQLPPANSLVGHIIRFCLLHKVVVGILLLAVTGWGLMVAPFDFNLGGLPRNPVPVDAIPDIGENQQIVFTRWEGRSPQDVEDQVSYPLTVALLGLPGVKTVRSFSMFGFSSIYVIFDDSVEFYWSRSRVLEKLASLPQGTLPKRSNPPWGRMPHRLVRSSGIPLKAEMKRANRLAAGIWLNFVPFRTGMCATPSWASRV